MSPNYSPNISKREEPNVSNSPSLKPPNYNNTAPSLKITPLPT